MLNHEPILENETQNSLGFLDTNESPNLGQTTRLSDSQHKKKTNRIVDFAVQADNRAKLKGSEKGNKYVDLARKLKKKPWKMKVTMIRSVQSAKDWYKNWRTGK